MSTFDLFRAKIEAGDIEAARDCRPRITIVERPARGRVSLPITAWISAGLTLNLESENLSRHPQIVELTPDQLASVVRFAIDCGFLKGFTASGEPTT